MSDSNFWQTYALTDLAHYHNGYAFKPDDWRAEGTKIIRIEQLNKPNGRYDYFSGDYPSVNHIEDGDLIFSWSATLKVVIWKHGCGVLNQHLFRVDEKEGFDKHFLYYLLDFHMDALSGGSHGSTMKHIKRGELQTYKVKVPPLPVQKRIAQILNSVDNQIDATQALIDKYTAIKQGMMADLFSRGIDPETKALRPSFEDAPELYHKTPLGMLPKGWNVVELQTVATVERGKFTHRPRDDKRCFGGEYPFIQTGDVAACVGNHLTQYKQTLSDFGRSVSKEFPVGTVAVTIAANIADTAILAMPMCFPDSVVGVVVDERLSSSRFVELCIRMSKAKLDALAPQSAQKNINLEDLRPLKLPFPSRVEQELVCSSYEAINDPVNSLIREKKKLIAQKSGLMQDLLTGKVQVPA